MVQSYFVGLGRCPRQGFIQPPDWRGDSRDGWTVWLSPAPFSGPLPFGPSKELLPLSNDPWILPWLKKVSEKYWRGLLMPGALL